MVKSNAQAAERSPRVLTKLLLLLAMVTGLPASAIAAENGTGFYVPGSKGPFAGVLPGPGVYFQNDVYVYLGSVNASQDLFVAGKLITSVDATAHIDLVTGLWVLPQSVFGGNIALSATVPWGGQTIDVRLNAAGIGRGAELSDDIFTVGEPMVGGSLGWHNGNWQWTPGYLVNVPIGDCQIGDVANLAFHRWRLDLNGAVTWFDPASGWEVSGAAGFTFNEENSATNYRYDMELHYEGVVVRSFSPQFSAGLVGYFYKQVTADRGTGASLGNFEGRVAALEGTAGYNFQLGNTRFRRA